MTDTSETKPTGISFINIEDEMESSYLDYAMSVIVSRALPDIRDGLKPVHRRILYAMKEGGYDKNFRKSARIVGDVMGKYHPHGDSAIYDAMVRMAQDFSMRLPLVKGQGNFGSMDGDPPAAMRYTEAKLDKPANSLLEDIEKNTVSFQENYDNTTQEPTVLPSKIPNLLVNGASGIAVGMATNIPPHNLGEVIDACCALLDNPNSTTEDLMKYVLGPDFPTGGAILKPSGSSIAPGIKSAYETGHGSLKIRSKISVEQIKKGKEAIIVTEIPYQVNKSRLMQRIAEVSKEKIIEDISELRDESDRKGVRVVIELKKGSSTEVVKNKLFRHTPLQVSFGINMLALYGGKPITVDLKTAISAFVDFRREVITKRATFDLAKSRERANILVGLVIAVNNLDEMIALIKKAKDPEIAKEQIMAREWSVKGITDLITLVYDKGKISKDKKFKLSELQAKSILDLRLHRLTGLERDKIAEDLKGVVKEIAEYLEILNSEKKLASILRNELIEVKTNFADERRTIFLEGSDEQDDEDLIQKEDMVITVSRAGYIKRVPLSTYRAQRRGGKGRAGMQTREEDFVTKVFFANTHTSVLFFSNNGKVYKLKAHKIPQATPQSLGKALINLLPLAENENITTLMPLPEDQATWAETFIVFATAKGNARRNRLSDFTNVMANGKIAMKLNKEDLLIGVETCRENEDVLLASKLGKCIRFKVPDIRVFSGRSSSGVRGIRLKTSDEVISMTILKHADFSIEERDSYLKKETSLNNGSEANETKDLKKAESAITLSSERIRKMSDQEEFILTISQKGYGKRSSAYDYRITRRGGSGITNMELKKRNGSSVTASFPIDKNDHIVLVTDQGKLIRCPINDVRIARRQTQGVKLFDIADNEKVVSVTRLTEMENGEASGLQEEKIITPETV
ncbi:MAG TPA: DNA gyrase subunit A, partial [Alphaproteobacteria bacterium]|nr:DNA gyrase subunit A [Alphaproteobacteria bacterium]